MTEAKKGYDSLMAEYNYWAGREPRREKEWWAKVEWAVARAEQYAKACGTDRDTVLAAWESQRDYWYVNYYQECNQPSLAPREDGQKATPVMMIADWHALGHRLYGPDPLDWRYRCPMCGHVQTPREFKDKGFDPNQAITYCASRFGLGGKKSCKWTTGGLLSIGGVYVVTEEYHPVLAFAFADEEGKYNV